jgi:hypothetical protein
MTEPIGPHYCSACGQQHGGGSRKDPDVEIARINAERDIRVAELARGEFKTTPLEAETQIAVAEIEAGAAVAVAEELGSPDEPEPETQAIVVEGPPAEPPEEPASIEPASDAPGEPPAPRKSHGYWP